MKNFMKKNGQPLLYIALFILTFVFFFIAGKNGENHKFVIRDEMAFESPWNYEFENGTKGITDLPARLDGGDSKSLTLTNTLPRIPDDTTLFFRSRHTNVKIYVDNVCVYNEKTKVKTPFPLPGNAWIEVDLNHVDTGKEIRIEETSYLSECVSGPGSIYLGERASFLMKLESDNAGTIVGASVLLILAFILIVLWIMLYVITKEAYNECLCLALFTLSIALWGYTESRCLQFGFSNMSKFSIFAFEILAIAPVPIARYFTYSKREKTRRLAKIAALIPMIVWIVNNVLHFLHVKDLAETLTITQVMIVIDAIFIGYIQITDSIYNLRHEKDKGRRGYWLIPLCGLGVLVPLLMVDMLKYIFSDRYYVNQANMTCIGIVIYIIMLACYSGLKLVSEKSKATSANEAKSQFLANMSHEIRTPLNAILGLNQMILRSSDDKRILEYASDINSSGENLKEMINKILDLSKIESGKMEIINVSYSTVQLIDNVTSMIATLAEEKALELKFEIDPELPEQLIGDETHIRQVLVNLMTNAVKYTKEGSVTFKVKVKEMDKKKENCKVLFAVKDTGIGIREEDKKRLFMKFERLDYNKNKNVEGTGLGMTIVAELLEAMASKIEIESVYGEGSEFSFVLQQRISVLDGVGDYEAGRKSRSIEKEQHESYTAPEARILIVDDVQVNLKVACGLLKPLKMQVDTAESGFEAVKKVEKQRYDLILMDHMMPEMNGIEATKRIRELCDKTGDTYYCKLPILALTANVMSGMYERYIEEGMQDFISKPINGRELEEILLKWLPRNKIIFGDRGVGKEEKQEKEETEESKETTKGWDITIAGIDMEEAQQYYSDEDMYKECLKDYLNSISRTAEKIEKFRQEEDIENYTITVHGLKSASKMVGAMEISEKARILEGYGHEEKCEEAWKNTDELLGMLKECESNLKNYFGISEEESKEDSKVVLEKDEMLEKLAILKGVAENFDMQGLMEWEETYGTAKVSDEYGEVWKEIMDAVERVAFMDIVEQISQLQEGWYPVSDS